jgi:hypothetical protein
VLSLEQVSTALEAINSAYARQGQLLQARTNLVNALGSALSSSFDNALKLADQDIANAKTDKERIQLQRERDALEQQAANARRASLERAQTLELLTFDLRQRQLQIENQIEQARIRGAIAENQAAQARAEANIATLQASGADAGQVRAAQLQLQADRQTGEALAQQFNATLEQGGLLQAIAGLERSALLAQQGSATSGFDVAELDRRFQSLESRAEGATSRRERQAIEAERQQLQAQNNQLQRQTNREIQFLGANEAKSFSEAVAGLERFSNTVAPANPSAALNPFTPLAQALPQITPSQQLQPQQQGATGAANFSVTNDVTINITGADVGNGGLAQSVEDQVFAGLSKVVQRASTLL